MIEPKYTEKRIAEFLKAANSDLGNNKYSGDEMIPDYCMAVKIGQQLQAELDKANAALVKIYNREDCGCCFDGCDDSESDCAWNIACQIVDPENLEALKAIWNKGE